MEEDAMEFHDLTQGHTGMFASELAEAFLEATGDKDDPDFAAHTRMVIMLAAETLAEIAGPGRWGNFDAVEHLRRIDHLPRREREGTCLVLMGLFRWMLAAGYLDPGNCLRVLGELLEAGPESPILEDLYSKLAPPIKEALQEIGEELD
jgi:hypothetical protein